MTEKKMPDGWVWITCKDKQGEKHGFTFPEDALAWERKHLLSLGCSDIKVRS